jgi:hypothetical protein
LLDLILNLQQDLAFFDVRYAACECLKAYFSNHIQVREHFLGRAIEGHETGNDDPSNILNVLLRPSGGPDPYGRWFAAVLAFHLLYEHPVAKAKALAITEGDESSGEEVVTSIHTVAAHLITSLRRDDDPRITVGYLMLLIGWLFEDIDAVSDFLSEGSNVQSLILAALQPGSSGGELVQGLCVVLLGVAYEFSTKDSPIPRATLQSILLSRLGRDIYLDRLSKLRNHPLLREFEVTPQQLDPSTGLLPDVFFDAVFVNFFKDTYSRLVRAIDRDPGLEISVANGIQKGISRELVDSLRAQLETQSQETQSLQSRLDQVEAEHRKLKEEAAAETRKLTSALDTTKKNHAAELKKQQGDAVGEIAKLKAAMDNLGRSHQSELKKQQNEAAAEVAKIKNAMEALRKSHDTDDRKAKAEAMAKASEHERQLEQLKKTLGAEADRLQRRTAAEIADLKATISRLEVDVLKVHTNHQRTLCNAAVSFFFFSRQVNADQLLGQQEQSPGTTSSP